MLNRRTFLLSAVVPLTIVAIDEPVLHALVQKLVTGDAPTKPAGSIPPISYTCTMHAEVVDDHEGKCPICGMTLVPIRLALVYSCPVHREITEPQAGTCKVCGRDLLRVTKSVTFTCRVHAKVDELNPGNCPICKRVLVMRYSIRPHGDHNPKHGGFFLMASNNWHLEVTHPAESVFRLYVYDAYSKPFKPPGLAARIIEAPNKAGMKTAVNIPFDKVPRADYLEARIPGLGQTVDIAAKVRFEQGDEDYRCDFMFTDYSKEPPARVPPKKPATQATK
jgi:hypothetical protein